MLVLTYPDRLPVLQATRVLSSGVESSTHTSEWVRVGDLGRCFRLQLLVLCVEDLVGFHGGRPVVQQGFHGQPPRRAQHRDEEAAPVNLVLF